MIKIIYTTFGSKEEAETIARKLLEERLIACANIHGNTTSIYRWEGEVRQQDEAMFFAKTTDVKATEAMARIKKLHSYELPCILLLPVESTLIPFMDWVASEVA